MAGCENIGHSKSPFELITNVPLSQLKVVPVHLIPKGDLCIVESLEDIKNICKLAVLMEFICEREKGVGLSAVQLGVPLNIFIVKFEVPNDDGHTYRVFVNCSYEPLSQEKEKSIEGCLSIRKNNGEFRQFEVDRFVKIKVKGKEFIEQSLSLIDVDEEPTDLSSVIFQHEIDHASQITIDNIGKEVYVWQK